MEANGRRPVLTLHQTHGSPLEGEALLLLPSYWLLTFPADRTFGFQGQFYGSLDPLWSGWGYVDGPSPCQGRENSRLARREQGTPHPGFNSRLCCSPARGLEKAVWDYWALPFFCVQINCLWQMLCANFKGNWVLCAFLVLLLCLFSSLFPSLSLSLSVCFVFKVMRCQFYVQLSCACPKVTRAPRLHFKTLNYKHIHDI